MSKIVSDDFRAVLPNLVEFDEECRDNTAYFELKTGVSACSHIKHLGDKLIEALDKLDELEGKVK